MRPMAGISAGKNHVSLLLFIAVGKGWRVIATPNLVTFTDPNA